MRTIRLLSCIFVVCVSISTAAQTTRSCSPVGTWYGGSEYPYMLTITPVTSTIGPVGGEIFAIRYEAVYDNSSFGYRGWTSWSGQLFRMKNGQYVGQAIARLTTSSELPPPSNTLELDAVRMMNRFVDCSTIKSTIDFFGAYLDPNKIPFVDQADIDYLPPGGIVEVYRRMPTTCPACSFPGAPTAHLLRKR